MPEVPSTGGFGNITNYKVSLSKGQIYESAKEPTEGFEEVQSKTDDRIFFHRYIPKGLYGKLTYMKVRTAEFKSGSVRSLNLIMSLDGESSALQINVDEGSGLSRALKAFIKTFFHIDFSKEIIVNYYKTKPNQNGKQYVNCAIEHPSGDRPSLLDLDNEPKPKKATKAGKVSWDYSEQDERYFNKLEALITRRNEFREENKDTKPSEETPPAKEEKAAKPTKEAKPAKPAKETKPAKEEHSDDDLPF